MPTKPSPDAIKMLKSIEEYFNQAFISHKYSELFRREFTHIFNIDWAYQTSIFEMDVICIPRLGFLNYSDYEKNIEQIKNEIDKILNKKEECIQRYENLVPLIEKDKAEGKIDDIFVEIFYQILGDARKWRDPNGGLYAYLPPIVDGLTGNTSVDYKTVQKKLSKEVERKRQSSVLDDLYQQFCEWIDLPSTKKQYGNRRWNAMKEKLALRGRHWFGYGEINDIESAKKVMSEVFYPDQEEYYKQLENWAKSEIEDKDRSRWIASFLWTGRTIPIRQVQLLKFKGNLEKGKAFLLSKYEEKLGWDRKKQKDREFSNNSILDTFDRNYNSFQEIWKNFENKYSLFPICICSNVEENNYPKLSMFGNWPDGIKLQHDTVQYSLVMQDMTLLYSNRYFYTYRSKYKKGNKKIIIYSDESFKLIKEYLQEVMPEVNFNENLVGCITLIDSTLRFYPVGITALLSYSKNDYSKSPKVLAKFESNKSILASKGFQNTLGYRVFTNAAIYHIAKKIGHAINLPLDSTISNPEFKSLKETLESKMDDLSFEDRYLCYFIDTQYKFPTDQADIFDVFRLSRRVNLFHNVQHHYSTPIFQEWQFPYGKIVNQYNNEEFKKNTEAVGDDFYKYRDDINIWFDKTNKHFLFNLRTLCYLNWVFVCNETMNIKKLSSLWLYKILYSCHFDAYQKDKTFFSSIMYYTLIQNERIFIAIIDKFLESDDKALSNKYDSSSIFYHLVQYYSNNFKGWGKEMSYYQLLFLNDGKKKHDLPNLFSKNHVNRVSIEDTNIQAIASKLFDFISRMLDNDAYPHSEILEIFKNMEPFNIPDNFKYKQKQSYSFSEYNGDYTGTYAHDVMGYTNDEIDTIFDGNPEAYWNIN